MQICVLWVGTAWYPYTSLPCTGHLHAHSGGKAGGWGVVQLGPGVAGSMGQRGSQ